MLAIGLLFQPNFRVFGAASQYFLTKIDLALSSPTGLGLGAADRKIRDLHVRGFCHSSEYISNGSESEKESKKNGIQVWELYIFKRMLLFTSEKPRK